MDICNFIASLFSAFAGVFIGACFLYYFQRRKYRNLHKIAEKALTLLEKYNSFKDAENEFNAAFSVAEKRSVLVALQKLGVPFDFLSMATFNIKKVLFLNQPVIKIELKQMKEQINNGNCDSLFHQDVETCFLENKKLSAVRNSAIKFVELVMKKSKFEKGQMVAPFPFTQVLTFGELTTNAVFRMRINYEECFDKLGNPIEEKMNTLIQDIEFGYYDTLLFWDFESYLNMQNQNNLANIVRNSFINPNSPKQFPTQNNESNIHQTT